MFFSHELLTRKGAFAKIWLAGNHQKLSKKTISSINICDISQQIQQPPVKLALRLDSQLLYGLVIVFQKRVAYLFGDAKDIFTRLKTTFIPGRAMVDLPVDKAQIRFEAITLPAGLVNMPEAEEPLPLQDLLENINADDFLVVTSQLSNPKKRTRNEVDVIGDSADAIANRFNQGAGYGLTPVSFPAGWVNNITEDQFPDEMGGGWDVAIPDLPSTGTRMFTPPLSDMNGPTLTPTNAGLMTPVNAAVSPGKVTPRKRKAPTQQAVDETTELSSEHIKSWLKDVTELVVERPTPLITYETYRKSQVKPYFALRTPLAKRIKAFFAEPGKKGCKTPSPKRHHAIIDNLALLDLNMPMDWDAGDFNDANLPSEEKLRRGSTGRQSLDSFMPRSAASESDGIKRLRGTASPDLPTPLSERPSRSSYVPLALDDPQHDSVSRFSLPVVKTPPKMPGTPGDSMEARTIAMLRYGNSQQTNP